MANGSWEEAKACPKCSLTGEQSRGLTPLARGREVTRGARLVTFTCRNSRCKWFNESWVVQINPDGTIPDPNAPRGPKQFPKVDEALVAQIQANAKRIQEMSTHPGAEVIR